MQHDVPSHRPDLSASEGLLFALALELAEPGRLAPKLERALSATQHLLLAERVSIWLWSAPLSRLICAACYSGAQKRTLADAELAQLSVPPELARHFAADMSPAAELTSCRELFVGNERVGALWLEAAAATAPELVARVVQLLGLCVSVSRHDETQRELARNAELYRHVLDDQPDVVLRSTRKGEIMFTNRAAQEFGRVSEQQAVGLSIFHFVPQADHAYVREQNARLSTEEPLVRYEHRTVRDDGSIAILSWITRGLFDEAGKLRAYQAIGRDVTREREQEEALHTAQRLESLAVLAGGIAHDFNNLLTPILGYAEVMSKELADDARQLPRLEEIVRAAQRAQQLVRQILVFGQKDAGPLTLIEVAPAVRETLDFLRATLPANIQLELGVDSNCGVIRAQSSDLYQILSNLCANAFQAMPAGGVLSVSASRVSLRCSGAEQPYCQILVHDTGHGIEPDVQKRIFEPFFTTKRPGEGTGLGLSMVHGRVSALGGSIAVQSRPGQGTSFAVILPLSDRVSSAPSVESTPPGSVGGRILVVDDEPGVAELLRELLEALGYRAESRTSPNDALALFLRDPEAFSLVITDLTMPRVGGIELAFRIHRARPDLPVLLMTGFGELLTREDMQGAGIVDVLKKPFRTAELESILQRVLGVDWQ